jgi:uncharacterized repeat protein (TIGR03803 family)
MGRGANAQELKDVNRAAACRVHQFCCRGKCSKQSTVSSPLGPMGMAPMGDSFQASDGSFYGTTFYGGTWDYGTVLRMRPDGVATAIASFDATNTNQHPYTGLVPANDGNYYGSTWQSALFSVTPAGQLIMVGSAADGDLCAASDACRRDNDDCFLHRERRSFSRRPPPRRPPPSQRRESLRHHG